MKFIKLKAKDIESIVFDVSDLADYLNQLTDQRDNRGKVYEIGNLLAMVVLARLSGQDKPYAIFEWVRNRQDAFVELFSLKRKRTPCLNTFRTLMSKGSY